MREVIDFHKNGNYSVILFSDGTMIRSCSFDKMIPEFPDSLDIKLTNKCSGTNCKWCHEHSGPDGKHGKILDVPFLDSMPKGTQLALGGGNVLEHPDFLAFLDWCKEKQLIPSITLNQKHFMENLDLIRDLAEKKLIYGLGVSLTYPTQEFMNAIREFPNAVIHVIAGIVSKTELDTLKNQNFKMLILGYKQFRRGKDFYTSSPDVQRRIDNNINWIKSNIRDIIDGFKVVSFDNLAIRQLDMKNIIPEEDWSSFYMGDDGHYTMYVDTINEEFAVSSTSTKRYKYSGETIKEMFKTVRSEVFEDGKK